MSENKTETGEKPKTAKTDDRVRTITFVLYPDSCEPNWQEILRGTGEKIFVSPIHDQDVDEGTGKQKKPHYHIIVSFLGKKSDKQVKEFVDRVKGVLSPNKKTDKVHGAGWAVDNTIGLARYLCHLDNADKHRYNMTDVLSFGAWNYATYIATHCNDNDTLLDEMLDFVNEYHVYSFMKFAMYCRKHKPEWSYVLKHSGAYYIKEAIKSKVYDDDEGGKRDNEMREHYLQKEGKTDPMKE